MKPVFSFLLLLPLLSLTACNTGREAFRSGDYQEAAEIAADRLYRNSNNEKAAEIFLEAYPIARRQALERAAAAEANEEDPYRWERVRSEYLALKRLATAAALTPFGEADGIVIDYHLSDIERTTERAGAARVAFGDEMMEAGDKASAREAIAHFAAAVGFLGERPEIVEKLNLARERGMVVVGVEPAIVDGHGISAARLYEALTQELFGSPVHKFVAFSHAEEGGVFDYYLAVVAGELSLNKDVKDVKTRDFRRKISEEVKTPDGMVTEEREIVGYVTTRKKTTSGYCFGRVQLFDTRADAAVLNETVEVSAEWSDRWELFSGDRRALDYDDLKLEEPLDPSLGEVAEGMTIELVEETRDQLKRFFRRIL